MRRAGPEAGFTLVEMLVAMTLLALVGLTLVRFQSFQLAGTSRLATIALARLEADNRAVELATLPEAPVGGLSGLAVQGGITFHWTATATPQPAGDLLADLVRIDVAVATDDGGPPLAERTLLRPQRLAPEPRA